jgi:hypothetical protein
VLPYTYLRKKNIVDATATAEYFASPVHSVDDIELGHQLLHACMHSVLQLILVV